MKKVDVNEISSGYGRGKSKQKYRLEATPSVNQIESQHFTPAGTRGQISSSIGRFQKSKMRIDPIPMTCAELFPQPVKEQLIGPIFPNPVKEPFPDWYDPNITCAYYFNTPGHSIEKCRGLQIWVQILMNMGKVSFEDGGPNIEGNPLSNHGGASVSIVTDGEITRKKVKEVSTPLLFYGKLW